MLHSLVAPSATPLPARPAQGRVGTGEGGSLGIPPALLLKALKTTDMMLAARVFPYQGLRAELNAVSAFLAHHIARLEGELSPSVRVVLRPAGEAWEVGHEGKTRIYTKVPKALRAVHALVQGARQLNAADYVLPGSKYAGNALREGITEQVRPWARKIDCHAIVEVTRHIRITKHGVAYYEPPGAGVAHFITE